MRDDPFDVDERRSAGKVLEIRSPFLPKPPIDVNHPILGPTIVRESTKPIAELTAQLAADMLATMPEDLRQAAYTAYQASQDVAQRLNAAQAELAALNGPAPAGLTIEQRGARHMRQIGLQSFIEELRAESERAGDVCTVALVAARDQVTYYSGRQIHTDARAKAHAMREEADRLIEEAGRLEIATMNALGKVNSWLPTEPIAPLAEPIAAEPAPKRRGLFK